MDDVARVVVDVVKLRLYDIFVLRVGRLIKTSFDRNSIQIFFVDPVCWSPNVFLRRPKQSHFFFTFLRL